MCLLVVYRISLVVSRVKQHIGGACVAVVFFKQKTAYDMLISDWSSDVCSSDLLEAGCPCLGHIAVLPVGAVHCGQVARHAGLHLLDALGGLGYREVPVTVVDGLELAPADGNDGPREQVALATQHEKLRAGRADRDRKSTRLKSSH